LGILGLVAVRVELALAPGALGQVRRLPAAAYYQPLVYHDAESEQFIHRARFVAPSFSIIADTASSIGVSGGDHCHGANPSLGANNRRRSAPSLSTCIVTTTGARIQLLIKR